MRRRGEGGKGGASLGNTLQRQQQTGREDERERGMRGNREREGDERESDKQGQWEREKEGGGTHRRQTADWSGGHEGAFLIVGEIKQRNKNWRNDRLDVKSSHVLLRHLAAVSVSSSDVQSWILDVGIQTSRGFPGQSGRPTADGWRLWLWTDCLWRLSTGRPRTNASADRY